MVASWSGGPPITVVDSLVGLDGGSWGTDGFLYYDGITAGGTRGIMRVPASGGMTEQVTTVDTAQGESDHVWPEVLPNAKGMLFTVLRRDRLDQADVAVADLETGTHRILVRGVAAKYAASGHLLYVTADGTLMAVPFNPSRFELAGEAIALVDGLSVRVNGSVDLAVSSAGRLAYVTGAQTTEPAELVWVERNGTAEVIAPGWVGDFRTVALSPDGSQLAASIAEGGTTAIQQLYIKQLPRGPVSKLTFDGRLNFRPAWTPNGRSVSFVSDRGENRDLYVKRADGSALAEVLLDHERPILEGFWSGDGQWLVYRLQMVAGDDLYAIRPGTDSVGVPLVTTSSRASGDEFDPALSLNGRWLAYTSNESGRPEVYVVPFPNTGDARWPVSTDGGFLPLWAHSGRELFYRSEARELVVVEVLPGETFAMGERQVLFALTTGYDWTDQYDVTPDDQRFVMIRNRGAEEAGELIVVENFFEDLKAKVGN
jgi:serine/threonine-protein kinase